MRKQMKIIYHHHSGFSIQLGKTLLVFDYWRGEKESLSLSAQLLPSFLTRFDHVYVFISHSHMDHYDPIVYEWALGLRHVEYLQGDDVPLAPEVKGQHVMKPGDELTLPGDVLVKAYPSTDLGVSFHVQADGLSIFHAGDLNLWHWREESTVAEINLAEDEYNAALQAISDLHFDVCMFPVDPRQGELYALGAERLIMTVRPSLFLPMHFFQYDYLIRDFANANSSKLTHVLPLTRDGTQITVDFTYTDGAAQPNISITMFEPQLENAENAADLDTIESGIFAGSDLPVRME